MKIKRLTTKLNKSLKERYCGFGFIEESAPISKEAWDSIKVPSESIMKLLQKKIDFIESENKAYGIQGQDKCPICGEIVNYKWTWFEGFIEFNCLNKCLSLPKTYVIRGKEYNAKTNIH